MKKYYALPCLILLILLSANCFAQGVWTWMSGTDTVDAGGVYGIQGVPSVNNHPPGTYSPFCWTDLQGNFWFYGGTVGGGIENADLWKFNPSTREWTWVKGNGQTDVSPVQGTQGVPDTNNTPGNRAYSGCTWTDANNDLWFYGGSNTGKILSADLWRYNIASNEWTWMSGTAGLSTPEYGTEGIPSLFNSPGGRGEIGSSWVDAAGKFWLYGGQGVNYGTQSDMWMYDPSSNMWTWESGADTSNAPASYGTKGHFSQSNTPGGRWPYSMWTDNCGNLWLFGGNGISENADLWEYNISINEWAWISGTQQPNAIGVAGPACQGDSSYYPDARYENRAAWKDSYGNFWMFGGFNLTQQDYGDMWVYLSGCNQWARMSDGTFLDSLPHYGIMGVPNASNSPGARAGTGHWKDTHGNFWVFGGYNPYGITGDMWMYKPDVSCISNNCLAQIPVAGTITTQHDTICPGTIASLQVTGSAGFLQWQSSATTNNFKNISGANDSSLNQVLSHTTYYRIVAGSGICADTSAPFTLTVIPPPLIAFTSSTNGLAVTFSSSGGSGGSTSYFWNFGDGDTSNLASPTHTYNSADTFDVCLTFSNKTNCNYTVCQNVETYPTGINTIPAGNRWMVYPNPFTGEFQVVGSRLQVENIEIYNVLGQMVLRKYFGGEQDDLTIDASGLANGMYFLKITTRDSEFVQPVVKE